jgi:hypothetical protein
MFAAYSKIKSGLQPLPKNVDVKYIKYYQTNFRYTNIYADHIYQIDIKSCYSNILFNNGLISIATNEYITEMSKENRLAAIGMLASKKNVFEFDDNGKCINHSIDKSKLSDYFFFCVQETYLIMDECKRILGDDFLFIWVDAIYINGNMEKANEVVKYFKEQHNLESSINRLEEFEVELRKDFYRVRYIKDNEKTFMDIPTPEQSEKTELMNFLLNIKREQQ